MVTLTQQTTHDNLITPPSRDYDDYHKADFNAFFLQNVIQNTESQVYINWNPNPEAYPALPQVVKYLSHFQEHHLYAVCLAKGLPKRVLHTVPSSVSSLSFQYLFSLK
jgi:hypothetical protein